MERISWEDRDEISSEKIGDEELDAQLEEDREMIRELTPPLDDEKLKKGEMTSVYFGSAMGDQGVEPFLDRFHRPGVAAGFTAAA